MRNLNGSELSEQCSQMLAMWRHSRAFRVSFLCGNSCSRTVSSWAYMSCGKRDRKAFHRTWQWYCESSLQRSIYPGSRASGPNKAEVQHGCWHSGVWSLGIRSRAIVEYSWNSIVFFSFQATSNTGVKRFMSPLPSCDTCSKPSSKLT